MKTTFKNSLVVLAMLGAITSYANLKPSISMNEGIKTTMLTFDNLKVGQRLTIKSVNGTILYKESINKPGYYSKEFDLTSLPNGSYFFELEKDLEIQIIPFTLSNGKVAFLKEKEITFYKPFVRSKNNKLYVSRLSFELKPLTIELYYNDLENSSEYEKIFTETVEGTQIIERIYSMDKEKKGSYKIKMKTEGREFTQYFTI